MKSIMEEKMKKNLMEACQEEAYHDELNIVISYIIYLYIIAEQEVTAIGKQIYFYKPIFYNSKITFHLQHANILINKNMYFTMPHKTIHTQSLQQNTKAVQPFCSYFHLLVPRAEQFLLLS